MRMLFIVTCILSMVSCHSEHSNHSGLIISPENPNYYEYNGEPTLIISATEHYFSLVNSKFDYNIYLNRLHSLGFNMASIMSGVFLEPSREDGENLLLPWKRGSEEGYRYGGNKFDLSQWNDAYFDRLDKFVSTANSKDIFVKYIFFAPIFDDHKWSGTPFNPANNVNSNYAHAQPKNIYTLEEHQGLLDIQKELIDRVTAILSKYPNVIYEVTFNGDRQWNDYDWYLHMHNYLLEKMPEPKKTVIFNMGIVRTPEYDGSTEVPMVTFEGNPLEREIAPEPFSGAAGISYMFTGDKQLVHIVGKGMPVLHAESSFRPNWEPHVRQHAYRTLLSGAGAYTFVDFVFNVKNPDGNRAPTRPLHGGGPDVHHSMSAVSKILNTVNFVSMQPNHSLVSFKNSQFEAAVLAIEGEEYLAHISPAPAPENYRVVFKGFIKPNTEGSYTVKAQANSTIRFKLGGKELINRAEYSTANKGITETFQYGGINPIPFELESEFRYYGNDVGLFLDGDSLQREAISYEQLLCTDGVTEGVEATYYTGYGLDEKQVWRIEKKVEHKGVSSPFFNEDQVHRTSFGFALPAGEYHCQWLDTKTASVINEFTIQHNNGGHRFHTPVFQYDIVLKVKKTE